MQNKGFPVPTTAYGNSTAQMNRDIRVYLQALVNINLLVSYHIIQLLLLQNPALKRHWDRRDPEIMVPFYSKSLPYSTGTKSECPWFSMARMETDRNLLKLGHLFQAKLLTCRKKTKKRSRYGFLLIESFNIFLSEIQVWKKICEKTSNNFGSAQCVSFSECPSAPNPAPHPHNAWDLLIIHANVCFYHVWLRWNELWSKMSEMKSLLFTARPDNRWHGGDLQELRRAPFAKWRH